MNTLPELCRRAGVGDDAGRRLVRYRPDLAARARSVGGARYWTDDDAADVLAVLRAHRERWSKYYPPASAATGGTEATATDGTTNAAAVSA